MDEIDTQRCMQNRRGLSSSRLESILSDGIEIPL